MLEKEANKRGLNLTIEHYCVPLPPAIACLAGRHINEADYAAGPENATWMNVVASGLTTHGQLSACWDRLFQLARLPLTGDDGSAIFFCVRRWVPSVAFPYIDGEHPEFQCERGIIYDNGGWEGQTHLSSQIVHELLHLYGAVDLAPGKSHHSVTEYANKNLDDIMHTPTQRPLEQYKIGDLTGYLIGWSGTRPECLMGA